MPQYRYLATDLLTGAVREEIPFDTVKVTHTRSGAGAFKASAPLRHPKVTRANLDPARTLIVVERDSQVVGNGILWGADPDGSKLSLTGASLWSYFHRRLITSTRTYAGVEQTTIATDLVKWAQGTGSLSYGASAGDSLGDLLIETDVSGTGKTRDRTYFWFDYKNLGDAIVELASVRGGFDFDVLLAWDASRSSIDRTFTTWYPQRGRRTNIVLELGTNIESYSLQVDAGSQAIKVHGIGKGEGPEMVATSQVDATLLGTYPLLEDIVTHKDVKHLSTLEDHAAARLAARRLPVTRPSMLNVRLGTQLQVGYWQLGDEVRLRMADGWVDVDSIYRIEEWSISVDQNGKETVDMKLVETEAG